MIFHSFCINHWTYFTSVFTKRQILIQDYVFVLTEIVKPLVVAFKNKASFTILEHAIKVNGVMFYNM